MPPANLAQSRREPVRVHFKTLFGNEDAPTPHTLDAAIELRIHLCTNATLDQNCAFLKDVLSLESGGQGASGAVFSLRAALTPNIHCRV